MRHAALFAEAQGLVRMWATRFARGLCAAAGAAAGAAATAPQAKVTIE